jgi:hypothetical protein
MSDNDARYMYQCLSQNCNRWFRSSWGFKQHIDHKHPNEEIDIYTGKSNYSKDFQMVMGNTSTPQEGQKSRDLGWWPRIKQSSKVWNTAVWTDAMQSI